MFRRLMKRLFGEEHGQDLIEYSLLLAFLALAAFGIMNAVGDSAADPWDGAQDAVEAANSSANGQDVASDGSGNLPTSNSPNRHHSRHHHH